MAIDRTGINSLNAGAPEITYSGNEGPKSPQQEQQMQMAKWEGSPGMDSRPEVRQAWKDFLKAQQEGNFNGTWEQWMPIWIRTNLAYGGAARPTYTQSRKQRMAGGGIAGLRQIGKPGGRVEPGISKYGMFDFITEPLEKIKDKIVDDLIPNELKNPAALATLAGLGLNQWGLPVGIESLGLEKGAGQNWLGDLLGGVMPGDTQFNTVFGDTLPFRYEDITSNPLPGGFDQIVSETLAKDMSGIMGQGPYLFSGAAGGARLPSTANVPSTLQRYQKAIEDAAKTKLDQSTLKSIYDTTVAEDTTRADGSTFNWKTPVAAGLAAGAYTASQPRDT